MIISVLKKNIRINRLIEKREISVTRAKYKIEHEDPLKRTIRILKNDMKTLKSWFTGKKPKYDLYNEQYPTHCDVLIIGGGAIGSSIAYWMKEKARQGLSVVVVEKDFTYKEASTTLSVGGVRQQFSLPENISMSLFGAEFLRNIKKYCQVDVDVAYKPNGYLTLATEAGAEQLTENQKIQKELGAKTVLLSPYKLKEKFPWLDIKDIELGCFGLENEGWFDPWALLYALKQSAINFGADYVQGEAIRFEFKALPDMITPGIELGTFETIDRLIVKLPSGELHPIKFAMCIIAAGPHSGKVAEMARVGVGKGLLSIPLPIVPRKRYVYCFEAKDGPTLNTPLTVDPTGMYFRREGYGGLYISGKSPDTDEEEPAVDNLDVDYEYFDNTIWPILAQRVPAFNAIKMRSAWAGFYEYNVFDQNGIVGPHPYYTNLYIASGFSGHGIQHSPAVGRAISEMIIDGKFRTIDLSRLGFDRLVVRKPVLEAGIV